MELLARLKHPNVVEIYDGGVTRDDIAYIVMGKLEGTSLRTGAPRPRAARGPEGVRLSQPARSGAAARRRAPSHPRRHLREAWAFDRLGTHRKDFGLALEDMTPAAFKKTLG
jgi:hypothetical protein